MHTGWHFSALLMQRLSVFDLASVPVSVLNYSFGFRISPVKALDGTVTLWSSSNFSVVSNAFMTYDNDPSISLCSLVYTWSSTVGPRVSYSLWMPSEMFYMAVRPKRPLLRKSYALPVRRQKGRNVNITNPKKLPFVCMLSFVSFIFTLIPSNTTSPCIISCLAQSEIKHVVHIYIYIYMMLLVAIFSN